jgi:hypothetical protein
MGRRAAAVVVALTAVFLSPRIAMAGDATTEVAPLDVAAYAQLSAKWWQWAASTPFSEDGPFGTLDTDCGENQPNGNTWFLAGSFGPAADRTCAIPAGTRLFFPVVNVECSSLEEGTDFFGGTVAERRACVEQPLFAFEPLFATLDSAPIVPDLTAYTIVSPNFPITAVDGNPAGIPAGRGFAVSRGVWLLLEPLSPGTHELHFAGRLLDPAFGGFTPEATYHLTVQ